MPGGDNSRNHHWWPVGLQTYWVDNSGDVSWIESSGETYKKRAANRKIGYKIHGHTISRGSDWESNFESEFDIDKEVHNIISALRELKPLGRKPSELLSLMKLLFKKDRKLRDMCNFYHLDEELQRNILLLIHSLLIRSPANRSRYEGYPQMVGLPRNEEVGKANMAQSYTIAKKLCRNGLISNQYFVLLHSPIKKFIFGDGIIDWLTSSLVANRVNGRTLVPLTPHLCIYFCTPMAMRSTPNCASLWVAPWMVDWVNQITQIYSKDRIFFLGKPPELTDSFTQGQFLEHEERTDALMDMLDDVAGIKKQGSLVAFGALG